MLFLLTSFKRPSQKLIFGAFPTPSSIFSYRLNENLLSSYNLKQFRETPRKIESYLYFQCVTEH